MRRLPGQATLGIAMLLHRLVTLLITIAVLASVALAAIAWRLSQGPVDVAWLGSRIEEAANAHGGPTRLSIGSVALTWEGFRLGVDRPLDLRMANVTVTDESGRRRADIPLVEVSLSLYQLLLGRIAPRAVALDEPQLTVLRAADGTLSFDLGSLAEAADSTEPPPDGSTTKEPAPVAGLLAELARPLANGRRATQDSLLSQLRVVRVRDARIVVVDRQLGINWRAPRAEIELRRRPEGGVDGTADIALALGDQSARLTMSATLAAGASETHLKLRLTPVTPSALARVAPALAKLNVLDAPVGAEADLDLDANLALRHARFNLHAGAGVLRIGQGSVPILDAALAASGTTDAMTLQALQVKLRGHDGGPQTLIAMQGTLQRETDRLNAAVSIDLDQFDMADLGKLWPETINANARSWLVENITAGMARNGHADFSLAAPQDLSSIVVTRASGTVDGDGLSVHWLRPVPPIDSGRAQLRIIDPDSLEIVVAAGRQRLSSQKDPSAGGIQIRGGRMRITGLKDIDQYATIEAEGASSVPDALTLLREPRLGMLDRHPIDLKSPAGQANVKLTVNLMLDHRITMDDITIRAQGHIEGVHLGAIALGRDLDQGVFDLDATTDGLKLNGRALLASVPSRLDLAMDFRPGPATQIVETTTVSGQPDARQLAGFGLDATSVIAGPMQMRATLTQRRNGQGELAVSADLAQTEMHVAAIEWRKMRDVPAKVSARLTLDRDRLTGIDNILLDGDGLNLRGRTEVKDGKVAVFHLDRLTIGRSVAQGTIRFPEVSGAGPIVARINGPTLDLAPRFSHRRPAHNASPQARTEPPKGTPWVLDARFDRVLMAQDRVASAVVLHAEEDGRVFQRLQIEGRSGTMAPFLIQVSPDQTGRRFNASAADAGEVLRGFDVVRSMQGGRLSVQAHFEDATPGRPLTGTAEIENFRIGNAPALAKLLQAMTLYGLVEVMQGPGLGFTRLIAPFRLTDDALDLADARAFSPSLGLTAKGRLDLDAEQLDMQGTIVPAYFFNALLGNIPLVGKLFSPERGGGLFAASYTVHGALENPTVSVNPLTALTPGFLRGLFGIF